MGARLEQTTCTQRETTLLAQYKRHWFRTFCLQAFVIKELAVSQGNSSPDEQ